MKNEYFAFYRGTLWSFDSESEAREGMKEIAQAEYNTVWFFTEQEIGSEELIKLRQDQAAICLF